MSQASSVSGTTVYANQYYVVDGAKFLRNVVADGLGNVATSTYDTSTSLIAKTRF